MNTRIVVKNILKILFLIVLGFFISCTSVFADGTGTSTSDTTLPAPISIHLDIETASSTLYNGPITVSACSADASTTATVSAYCALQQSGLSTTWSAYSGSQFLDSVSGVSNDDVNNVYWGWFSNLEYGQTSLDQHILAPDENLLVTFGVLPLQISVSTTTPTVGATTTVSVSQFGFDASWNGVWLPAASSSVSVSNEIYPTDLEGKYDIVVASDTPFTVFATETGFIQSPSIAISPISTNSDQISTTTDATTTNATTTPPTDPSSSSGSSSSSGGGSNLNQCTFDTTKALQFLTTKQNSDGSFSSGLYTDWAAIALAAGQSSNQGSLTSYLTNNSDSLVSATDYERHTMALEALGINPYDGTSINYVQKIVSDFDGTQIGDPTLVNDDIFAIFPLFSAGYSLNDPIIQKTVDFIVSKQETDGSWEESVDLTAAAIQALSLTPTATGTSHALGLARAYLAAEQQSNGGFGSSFSTSWALQAISALGESSMNWTKNNINPQSFLCASQQSDGGVEPITSDDQTRIWATAYAIPAALNKPWASILGSFAKQNVTESAPVGTLTASATSVISISSSTATVTSPTLSTNTPTSTSIVVTPFVSIAKSTHNVAPTTISGITVPKNAPSSESVSSTSPLEPSLVDQSPLPIAAAAAADGGGSTFEIISIFGGAIVVILGLYVFIRKPFKK